MKQVEGVIFDIGNVIIYDFPMESRFLYNIFLEIREEIGYTSFPQFLKLRENYRLPYNQWVYAWGKTTFGGNRWGVINDFAWQDVICHWKELCIIIPMVMEEIYKQQYKYRFAVCANQPLAMMRFFQDRDIFSLFKVFVIDDGTSYSKPDLRMFVDVLQRLDLPPGRCMMVGDKYSVDIAPASKIGFQTALLLNNYDQMEKMVRHEWEYDYIQYMKNFNDEVGKADLQVTSIPELFGEMEKWL